MPGEATLWPSLTGEETLHLLGRVHGEIDPKYRDELIQRFDLDPSKKVRAYSKGNRQKLILIAHSKHLRDHLPRSGQDTPKGQRLMWSLVEWVAREGCIGSAEYIDPDQYDEKQE